MDTKELEKKAVMSFEEYKNFMGFNTTMSARLLNQGTYTSGYYAGFRDGFARVVELIEKQKEGS